MNGRNILVSMYRKVRENSRPRDLRLFTSTKGVVSVIKTSCAHSVTLKRINKTPHSFFSFPYCDMDKEIIMEVHELLIKVIVT